MTVLRTFEEVRSMTEGSVGLVPTMGFLHEGHLRLIEASVAENDTTVVTVFVNPTQFGEQRDLSSYPRDLERDVGLAYGVGADIVLAPSVDYMYPDGASTTVAVAGAAEAMEGIHRPGHFDGVATVVARFFAGLAPDRAYFGRKDAQQLAVVSSMVRDLGFPLTVRSIPTVREMDGLALSSRNVRIEPRLRPSALRIWHGLMAGASLYESGVRSVPEVLATVSAPLDDDWKVEVEYIELADAMTARPAGHFAGMQFLAVAATVGHVRLIDNVVIDNEAGTVERGTLLSSRSILYGDS